MRTFLRIACENTESAPKAFVGVMLERSAELIVVVDRGR